jgi:hypothetical protein
MNHMGSAEADEATSHKLVDDYAEAGATHRYG